MGERNGVIDYMGRKVKTCVPKLLDGLMEHLPPESASPGFCPLLSVMQSGVLLSEKKGAFLDTRVRHIWGGIPAILTCSDPALPFLGGSFSWSGGFVGKGQQCPETPWEPPAFSLPGCDLL